MSAQPDKRGTVRPSPRHLEHQAIRLVVRPDGSFIPADLESRRLCKERKFGAGLEVLGYLYIPRDPRQWAQAHQVGTFLLAHVEHFADCADSHAVLKKLQRESEVHCEIRLAHIEGTDMHLRIVEPKTLAFGWLPQNQWEPIWQALCAYIVRKGWLGEITDPDAAVGVAKLIAREQEAA